MLKDILGEANLLWDTYCASLPELMEFSEVQASEDIAAKFRHQEGGHLLFRPVGLLASVRVGHDLMDSIGLSIQEAVGRIARLPMDLHHEMWTGTFWNSVSKRLIASGENQSAGRKLIFFAAGGDLAYLKTTPSDLN